MTDKLLINWKVGMKRNVKVKRLGKKSLILVMLNNARMHCDVRVVL